MVSNSSYVASSEIKDKDLPVAQVLGYFRIAFALRDRDDAWFPCVFHEEQTPSCHISLRTGKWWCFGCQQGGGLEEFVNNMVHDPIASLGVIHRARVMPVPQAIEDFEEAWREARSVDPAVAWGRFYKTNWRDMDASHPVLAYFLGRGFLRDTLWAFDARLTEWGEYPVAFQIHDGGRLVGYARRRVTPGEPKYLYNRGFDAGANVAYYCTDSSAPCLVVEGVLDLMMAAQHGARRVAALLGWRLTNRKLDCLAAQGVREVVCATDNTPTGEFGWKQFQTYFGNRVKRFQFPSHRKDVGELSKFEFLAGMPTLEVV